MFWRKHWFWAVLSVVTILVGVRLMLPMWVQSYVNDKLDQIPEYDGQIGDVDLFLIAGAYSIEDVDVVKTTGEVPVPFFSGERVDFSVDWSELFHGAAVGEILVQRGKLNFVKGKTEGDTQTEIDSVWLEVVKDLFPFKINRFEIREGEVRFNDFHAEPKVDVYMTNLAAVCTNLYNTREFETELPADFRARGITLGEGEMDVHVKLDPLASEPKFDLELAIENMDLVALNNLLEAYGKFNVKRGTFEIFSEIAASGGTFDGYLKPFFKDLDVLELDQDAKNPLKLAWQAIIAGAMKIFKNHPEDQVATKIPVSGTFEKTDVGIWTAVVNVLRNAFVEAFSARLDKSINLFERDDDAKKKETTNDQKDRKPEIQGG
jgi:hypothetical protein